MWNSGVACVLMAAFSFSFVGLSTKLLNNVIATVHLTLLMGMCSWCLTTTTLMLTKLGGKAMYPGNKLPASTGFFLILRGIIGCLNMSCLLGCMQLLPLADAVPLYYSSAVVALFLEAILFCKRIGLSAIMGCMLTVGGVALVGQATCPIPTPTLPFLNGTACSGLQALEGGQLVGGSPAAAAVMAGMGRRSLLGCALRPDNWHHTFSTAGAQDFGQQAVAIGRAFVAVPGLLLGQGMPHTWAGQLDSTQRFYNTPAASAAGAASAALISNATAANSSSSDGFLGHTSHDLGVALALTGAVLNAIQFIVISHIGTAVSPIFMTWVYWTVLVLTTGGALYGVEGYLELNPPGGWHTWACVLGCALGSWGGQTFLSRGLQLGNPGRASAINTTQVFWSFIWDSTVLNNPVTMCGILGGCSIMSGVVAACWPALTASRKLAAAGDDDDLPSVFDDDFGGENHNIFSDSSVMGIVSFTSNSVMSVGTRRPLLHGYAASEEGEEHHGLGVHGRSPARSPLGRRTPGSPAPVVASRMADAGTQTGDDPQ